MITERRAVTILALATAILVGFLLFTDVGDAPSQDTAPSGGASTAGPSDAPDETPASAATPTVEPVGAGRCPKGFRVKGDVAESNIPTYREPGDPDYGSTKAQTCFATVADARAAGYQPAG